MEKKIENNWVFLPVHKTRILKQLGKANLILVDFNVTTILPNVFKRVKETKDFIFYSLPADFKVSIRVSTRNPQTRRYEHNDMEYPVTKLQDCGMDKPYVEYVQDVEIQEEVGNNVEPVEDKLPFED